MTSHYRFISWVRTVLQLTVVMGVLGSSLLYAQSLRKVRITYQYDGSTKSKSIYCSGNTPGEARDSGGSLLFKSYAALIQELQARAGTSKKIAKYKALNKSGKKACKTGGNNPNATPTPTGSLGNFDAQGNVTAQGRVRFGIPSNLAGNITQGKAFYEANCTGCHVERTGWTFPNLREAIRQAPMFYDEAQIPDAMLAHMTAYLNRFRVL